MPDPSKTVKIYSVLRVSTTEQADDDKSGLPTQRRIITKWLKRNNHPQGVEVIDSGLSARNLAQFEYGKLGKLLQKLEKQTFEPSSVMLVFAFSDRFSRADPTKGLQKFLEVLGLGIDLVFCDLDMHVSASENEQQKTFKLYAIISSFQQSSIAWIATSRRVSGAWETFRLKWIDYANGLGPKPTSNSLMKKPAWFHELDKNQNIIVHTTRSKYVKLIFDLFTKEHKSLLSIARHFNNVLKLERFSQYGRKKYSKNFLNKTRWTDASIRYVLKSRAVIGQQQFFYQVKKDNQRIKTPMYLDNGELAIVDGVFSPIITKEQFFLAQKLLSKNKHHQGKNPKNYPTNIFRSIMVDGYNGLNLHVTTYRKTWSYFRNNYAKNIGAVSLKPIPAIAFEKAFFSCYRIQTEDSPTVQNWNSFEGNNDQSKSDNIAQLKDEIESLDNGNNRLLELIQISPDKNNLVRYDNLITENNEKKDKLQIKLNKLGSTKVKSDMASFAKTFIKLAKFTKEEKVRKKIQTFLKNTDHKIYVYSTGLKWSKEKLLDKFKQFGSGFGSERNWSNFNHKTFVENPFSFLMEYAFIKCFSGENWKKRTWEAVTWERDVFEELFGKHQVNPENLKQNIVFYCNNPEGEDFSGVYSQKSFDHPELKYLVSGKTHWFRKINFHESGKSAKLDMFLENCQNGLIKNKLMDKQNVTFTRLIIMRFGRSKDKWQKLVFMKLKEVAKTYPVGWRLHVFTRCYMTMIINYSSEVLHDKVSLSRQDRP